MGTISLCMIAKDEERWIAQAIESVRPIVDEVILVDTGSSDRTVEIAEGLGAKVYFQPWDNDFSRPRNLSLEKATCDWILVLDADEVIAATDLGEVKRLTEDRRHCVEFLQRHYSDDHRLSNFLPCRGEFPELEKNHGGYFESNLVRLFPNHEGIHYRGKVHELVEHSIRDIAKHTIVRTEVRIHHYGHIASVKRQRNKSSIYTPLGEAKVREQPTDWKNFFELGVEHNNNGRLAESVVAFRQAARLNPQYVPTWINMGYVQCELQHYQDAVQSLTTALRLDPRSDEAYCNLGVVYLRTKHFEAAEQQFRAATRLNQHYVNAYCNLGTCLALQGRMAEAINIYLVVLEMFPTCQKAHAEAGALYLSGGVSERAEYHLRQAIALLPDDARSHLHLGQLLRGSARLFEATSAFQRFCELEQIRHGSRLPEDLAQLIRNVLKECDALTTQILLGKGGRSPLVAVEDQAATLRGGSQSGETPMPREDSVAGTKSRKNGRSRKTSDESAEGSKRRRRKKVATPAGPTEKRGAPERKGATTKRGKQVKPSAGQSRAAKASSTKNHAKKKRSKRAESGAEEAEA
ncbi:MAG: tetratricopeptide repeat protein [Bdellovibrionales bacterium]|nr:tetratricopeptide repeat protein [Bdellovibrionales bacterium]